MSWWGRLRNTMRPERIQADIDREIRFHLAERADQLRAEGVSADEAAARARRQFGSPTVQAERTRHVDIALRLDALLRDIRYSLRALRRTPGVTITVVLTLALGIGANSAIFSALDAVLLRPLPFPDPDRLMQVRQANDAGGDTTIAPVRLEEWHRLNTTFEAISGYYTEDAAETSGDLPERLRRAFVAPRFLDVWGVAPALGRGFTAAEHEVGGPGAVLISDRYWRRRFGSDPAIVGRTLRIGTVASPIVGVMPASFLFPDRGVDLWFPVALSPRLAQVRYATWYVGIGRLKPQVTVQQARANLAAVQHQLGVEYPDTDRALRASVTPLKEVAIGDVRESMWLLFGAVSVLLLITCTNVASVLLARAAQRRQEIAVCLSLGATRRSVAARVLTETGVLAIAGGGMGLVVATLVAAALRRVGSGLPRMDEVALGGGGLLYTLAVAAAVTLLCGLLPAIRASRDGLAGAQREAARTQVSTRYRVQWLLVGAQVALSVTLLAGAGLLVRSLQELWRLDPGFEPARVLTFRVSGGWAETTDHHRLIRRVETMLDAVRAMPGVVSASTATFLPGVPTEYEAAYTLVESPGDASRHLAAERRVVSRDYFATLQIPLVDGELCHQQPPAPEVLVNRAFVARHLGDWRSPIGLHLASDGARTPGRIVGIVGDARERGLNREPGPVVYACASAPNPTPYVLVRTRGEEVDMARAVRQKIKQLEPFRAVYDLAPLEERIGEGFSQNRLRASVLAFFSITALALSLVGLYGTLSYIVNLRRREIGLRLALGAMRREIVQQVVWQGLRVAVVGCLCGLALLMSLTSTLASMLYGISAADPTALASVVVLVLTVSALASLAPAMRAALVEPMRVLRDE